MSIWVVVRNEMTEQIEGASTVSFQKIVSWENRWRFPMLGFVDPLGKTVMNRLQVKALVDELTTIRTAIELNGVSATVEDIGADEVEESLRIIGWNPERHLLSLVDEMLEVCSVALDRHHRYLWFLGD